MRGYEIRHGRSEPTAPLAEALPGGLGWADGPLLAVSVHGLLEDREVLAALLGSAPARSLDQAVDDLTDAVMSSLDVSRIESLAATTRAL